MKQLLCLRQIRWSAVCLALAPPVLAADARSPIEVKTNHRSRGEIIRYATLPGTITANQFAALDAKVPGYLRSIAGDQATRCTLARRSAKLRCRNCSPTLRNTRPS